MPQFYVLDGVAQARTTAGLALADLARRVGISAPKLAAIEGKTHGARRKTLLKLALELKGGAQMAQAIKLAPAGLPAPTQTSTTKRFPKGIRVAGTKKGKREVRPA